MDVRRTALPSERSTFRPLRCRVSDVPLAGPRPWRGNMSMRSVKNRGLRAVPLIVTVLTGWLLAAPAGAVTAQTPALRSFGGLTRLSNEVVPTLSRFTDLGAVQGTKQVRIAVVLQHDQRALRSYEA